MRIWVADLVVILLGLGACFYASSRFAKIWIAVLFYGLSSALVLYWLGLGWLLHLAFSGVKFAGAIVIIGALLFPAIRFGSPAAGIACVVASIALVMHQKWGGGLARVGLIVHVFLGISAILLGLSCLASVALLALPHLGIRGYLLSWFEPRYLFSTFFVIGFFIVTGAIVRVGWHLFRTLSHSHSGGG